MTICALLEPESGSPGFFPGGNVGRSLASGVGVGHSGRWFVGLEPWLGGAGVLPTGLGLVDGSMGQHRVQGHLHLEGLQQWIRSLSLGGLSVEARALESVLQGHLAPAGVMSWGPGGRFRLDFRRPQVMGILNLTPDSFSGDGVPGNVADAVARGVELARQGADVVDVGGESTRPGAVAVPLEEELERVVAVVGQLARRLEIPVSVDTTKIEVMEAALEAGAGMINDVSALGVGCGDDGSELDLRKVALLAELGCPVVLMHRRGSPGEMQQDPRYGDVAWEVYRFLDRRIGECLAGGIDKGLIFADVGFGFGKTVGHNLELMWRQRLFRGLGVPLVFGVSRKRVVGHLSGEGDPRKRDVGSHVLAVFGMLAGAAVFRVHDVAGARQALATAWGWLGDGEFLGGL